jgi:hypothetical protein
MFVKLIETLKNIFRKDKLEDELDYVNYHDSYLSELNKIKNEEVNTNELVQ